MVIYDGNWNDEQWSASLRALEKENAQLREQLAAAQKGWEASRERFVEWKKTYEIDRNELEEAQGKLAEANEYTNMWADATADSQAELKQAKERIGILENQIGEMEAFTSAGYGIETMNKLKARIAELEGVLDELLPLLPAHGVVLDVLKKRKSP